MNADLTSCYNEQYKNIHDKQLEKFFVTEENGNTILSKYQDRYGSINTGVPIGMILRYCVDKYEEGLRNKL